jgi:type I restriction enzyme R subunit
VDSLTVDAEVDEEWRTFVRAKRSSDLDQIIAEEGLDPEETRAFVEGAFRDGAVPTTGTAITRVLPPVSRFSPANSHAAKKKAVLDKLAAFFERYFGLS